MPIFFNYYKQVKTQDQNELVARFNQLVEMGKIITCEKEMIRRAIKARREKQKRKTIYALELQREVKKVDAMRNEKGEIVIKF